MNPIEPTIEPVLPAVPVRVSPERRIGDILGSGDYTPKEVARLSAMAIKDEITSFRIDEAGTKPSEVRDLSTALANKCRAWQMLAQVVTMVEPKPEREQDGGDDDGWSEAVGAKAKTAGALPVEPSAYVPPPRSKKKARKA